MKLTKTEIIAELQYEYMRPERDADKINELQQELNAILRENGDLHE